MIFAVIPDVVARPRREASGVDVRSEAVGPGLSDALAVGRVDVVVARGDVEPALGLDGPIVRTRVASDGWTCLVRVGHPLAAAPLTLEPCLAAPRVAVAVAGTADPVDAALEEAGRRRRVAVTVPGFPAAGRFAAASDVIATLPERVAARAARRLDLVTRAPPLRLLPSETHPWWHERFRKDAGHAWRRGLLGDAPRPIRAAGPER